MGFLRNLLGIIRCRDGEIGVEDLVDEGRVSEARWVGERKGGE